MALTTLSVAMSVLVLKVHHTSPYYEVPGWVRRFVLGHLSSVVYMDVNNARFRHHVTDCSASNDQIWTTNRNRFRGSLAADKHRQATGAYSIFLATSCLLIN